MSFSVNSSIILRLGLVLFREFQPLFGTVSKSSLIDGLHCLLVAKRMSAFDDVIILISVVHLPSEKTCSSET